MTIFNCFFYQKIDTDVTVDPEQLPWRDCFRKKQCRSYGYIGADHSSWTAWNRVKTTGRFVILENKQKLYECQEDGKEIVWIDSVDLKFPVNSNDIER